MRMLFVTYAYGGAFRANTVMMGVLKRCLRLIEGLFDFKCDCQLLHFGFIPEDDPLVARLLRRIPIHHLPLGPPRLLLGRLYYRIAPDIVVLGEGPGRGMMLAASRAASRAGLRQLCIENYYRDGQLETFADEQPQISSWLLIGLPANGRFGRFDRRASVVPPLLPRAMPSPPRSVDFTILGYDRRVAYAGAQLLARLPRTVSATVVLSRRSLSVLPVLQRIVAGRSMRAVPLPSDSDLGELLQSSRCVICKNGFQQMVEALACGTPVLAVPAPGGVPEPWVDECLRAFIRFVPTDGASTFRALSAAAFWSLHTPRMPWNESVSRIHDPIAFAARMLANLVIDSHHNPSQSNP